MDDLKAQVTTEVWNPDALAKRLFFLAMVGVVGYLVAVLMLLSSAE